MIPRTSTISPSKMLESAYYNDAKYCGKTGYYKGNDNYQCVNYAMARTCEIAQRPVAWYKDVSTKEEIENPMMNRRGYGSAKYWWSETLWSKGSDAKVGAVMVYGSAYGNGYGHVRVVEKIDGDRLFISGGNESGKMAFKWIDKPSVSSTGFLGYIYNPYVKDESLIVIEKDESYDWKWSVDGNKYGDTYDITTEGGFGDEKLRDEGWELVLKVNGSLFYTYENEHFACGLEKSRGINNQDVSMSCVSKYNSCMAIGCIEDELVYGSQDWIIKNLLDNCYGAITGMGLILNGKKRSDMHKGFESQWNQRSGRTIIGEDKDGNILSYSIEGETGKSGITCAEAQDICLKIGMYNCICLDGGGSCFREHLVEEGKLVYDISTTRKVKNALLLYRKKKPVQEIVQPTYEELKKDYDDLKMSYELLLDTCDDLKNQIDEEMKMNESLTNRVNQLEIESQYSLRKLEMIKDVLADD